MGLDKNQETHGNFTPEQQQWRDFEAWMDQHLCAWNKLKGANEPWLTGCQLVGTLSEKTVATGRDRKGNQIITPFYCAWHFVNIANPAVAANYEEFVNWRLKKRESYPLTPDNLVLWADHELVWQAVRGELCHHLFMRQVLQTVSCETSKRSEPMETAGSEQEEEVPF